MDIEYKKACTDVLYIINSFDKRLKNKISKSFLEFLNNNCDKTYSPSNISISKPDTLSQETKNILSLIYRNYLDDRKNTSNIIKEAHSNNETNIKDSIEPRNLIPNDKSLMVKPKSNGIFTKIFNYLKRIFKHGGNN